MPNDFLLLPSECRADTNNEHKRAERWTALLFLRTRKPKELQQLRALSASPEGLSSWPLLRDGTSGHMLERMFDAELLQGPVVLTFSIARDGYNFGFETEGCVTGRAFGVCMPDNLNLCYVIIHVKASPRLHRCKRRCNSRMSVHFGYLRLGWCCRRRSTCFCVRRRWKMNSKSLNVAGDLISTGCSAGPRAAACSPRDRARAPPTTNTQRHTSVPAACQCALVT